MIDETNPTNEQDRSHSPARGRNAAEREDGRVMEANRRLAVLEAFWALQAGPEKMTPRAAAKAVGEVRVTLWRWEKRYQAQGFSGLLPKTQNCGRTSVAESLRLTEEEIRRVQGLHLDTESNTASWRLFAQSDECRPELARVILDPTRRSKHSIPPSLRAATRINANLKKAHRGPRALALRGMWTPRKVDILPGDIFTSDDTTPIWAWWVPWVECEEYPHGVKVMQGQFLPVMDVASQCIICFVLIAREKSSYRAVDIWNLFGHTFDTVGLPRLGWQLERGSWEANVIRGQEVEYQEGEVTMSRRVGGLRMLPVNLTDWHKRPEGPFQGNADLFPKTLNTWTSYLPKTKSIEAAFNRMQSLEGTIWGSLGRDQMRNPYEKAKKIYEACKRGAADPREHFLSQTEMLKRLRGILDYLNNEPMEGEVFRGIPRQLWEQSIAERPLFRMPEEQRYLFRRDWISTRITQGWARVRLTHEIDGARYSLFYTNPRIFAEREGEQIVAYYDRENFESPAQIHLAKTGEFLCEAHYEDRVGSFLGSDRSGHDIRKAWKHAVTSAYATIAPHAPSRQLPPEIEARRARAAEAREDERRNDDAMAEGISGAAVRAQEQTIEGVRTVAATPRPGHGSAAAEERQPAMTWRMQQLMGEAHP